MCTKMEVRPLRYKNASLRSNVLPETAKQMNAKVSLITGVTGQVGRRFVDCFFCIAKYSKPLGDICHERV